MTDDADPPFPELRCMWWSGRINGVGTRCFGRGVHKVKGGHVCEAHICSCGRKVRPGCIKCDDCNRQGSRKETKTWPCRTCSREWASFAELETHRATGCAAAYFARKRKALDGRMETVRQAKKQRTD